MTMYLIALLAGFIAGLRTFIPLAIISWSAYLGWLNAPDSWLSYLGNVWAVGLLTILMIVELVTDKLPTTPSRKVPVQFGARIVSGAIAGAAIGTPSGSILAGMIAGIIGAIIGTFAGHAFRATIASKLGNDLPAALIEDGIGIVLALIIVFGLL